MCNNNELCISKLLEKILIMQKVNDSIQDGCNKPFLGENATSAKTIPLNLYSCCTLDIWTMPYDYNGDVGESSVFKIENIIDDYARFRILIPVDNGYISTDNFFTIDLKNIACIKCLNNITIINI